MSTEELSGKYDAYLIIIGVAYVKMTETLSPDKKEAYQEVIDTLMAEMAKL